MIEKLVSKRSWIAINAGILLCAAAVPSAVLAQTQSSGGAPTSTQSSKVKAATAPVGPSLNVSTAHAAQAQAPAAAPAQAPAAGGNNGCPASIPSLLPDPVVGALANSTHYFGDSEAAITASSVLPAGWLGTDNTTTPFTGSVANPTPASKFAIGFFDETEMFEIPGSSFPHTELLPVIPPGGQVTHADGTTSPGGTVGMPYAAIMTTDLKTTLKSGLPTQVLFQNYTPNPTGGHVHMTTTAFGTCGNGPLYSILGFDVTGLSTTNGGPLVPGQVYAAYILMSDTDSSGPLANHVWYFKFNPGPSFNLTKDVQDANGHSINGQTVVKGTQLHYVVTLTNNGGAGDPGTITDAITKIDPSQFTVDAQPTPSQGTVSPSSGQGPWSWKPGSIAANGSATLTMPVTVNAEGVEIDNSACLPSATTCPIPCPTGSSACPLPCTSTANGPNSATVCNFTWILTKDVFNASAPPPGGASINGQAVQIGTKLLYVVTVKNPGTLPGDPGVLTDNLSGFPTSDYKVDTEPTGPGTILCGGVACAAGNPGPWTWDPGSIGPGATATLTLVVEPTSPAAGPLTNTVCLPGPAQTADCKNVTNNVPMFLVTKDVLDANGKSINGQTVAKGTQLTYVVTVNNNSTVAGDPGAITDKLSKLDPSLFTVDTEPSGPGSILCGGAACAAGNQGPWTWDPGSIDGGKSAQLTMKVTVNALGGELDNTACMPSVTDCSPCPTGSTACTPPCTALNNGQQATVCNPTTPPFSITKDVQDANGKSINGQTIAKGTQLNYVVTVTNNGTDKGDPGVVTDHLSKLDPSLFIVNTEPSGPGSILCGGVACAAGNQGPWTWDPGNIDAGKSATLTMQVTVNATSGEIDNTACLPGAPACPVPCPVSGTCPNPCPDVSNTPLSATVCNPLPPTVTLAKCIVTATDCVNTTTQAVGDTVTYKVTVTNPAANTGNADNVLVDDVVTTPDNLPFIVNDGVNLGANNQTTTNSFQGSPQIQVNKIGNNHYQWTFATLTPGQSGVVTFTITIGTPAPPAAGTTETLHVDNTASEPTFNPPPVTVHSNVPLTGGVLACTTTTCPPATPTTPVAPKTGAELNLRIASGFFVSGLFLILFGMVSRPRRRRLA